MTNRPLWSTCLRRTESSKLGFAGGSFASRTTSDVIRLPYRSPNLNAYVERFVLSIKSECLDRMIFFGEQSLRRAVVEFCRHYHAERNHQGLENALIEADERVGSLAGNVQCRKRLGGLLSYYHRDAA